MKLSVWHEWDSDHVRKDAVLKIRSGGICWLDPMGVEMDLLGAASLSLYFPPAIATRMLYLSLPHSRSRTLCTMESFSC
jgi:hypothetical protein